MLTITCPHCGPRDETEFVNGGEGHAARPAADVSDENWAAYLFFHANPRGDLDERWCHAYGCGLWFHATRCTATHRVSATYGIAEVPVQPE